MIKNVARVGKLCCPLDRYSGELFFSLVDYRNTMFVSDSKEKIIEFYEGFGSRTQLIRWMKERPDGVSTIIEVKGLDDIIVIIPTSDFHGALARNCRDDIFAGMRIIFVESGGRDDPYFNIARNINIGVKRALKYNPKWIVISGDDMYKIDDIGVLREHLEKLDPLVVDAVFAKQSAYHTLPSKIAKPRLARRMILQILDKYRRAQVKLEKLFNINFLGSPTGNLYGVLLFHDGWRFINCVDFLVVSSEFVHENDAALFDEIFINGGEEVDLSMKLNFNEYNICKITFQIGDYIGKTLGTSEARRIREIASNSYLNYKVESGAYKLS